MFWMLASVALALIVFWHEYQVTKEINERRGQEARAWSHEEE